MPQSPATTRARVVEAAYELYYRQGIQNVGLKEVARKAKVAYMSLYNHFASKDELVVAVLEHRLGRNRAWLDAIIASSPNPKAALLTILERQQTWIELNEVRGCTLINASIELANPQHPAHQLAYRYKEEVRGRLEELAQEAGLSDPATLSNQLMLLMDGSNVTAVIRSDPGVARYAFQAAKVLIESVSRHPL